MKPKYEPWKIAIILGLSTVISLVFLVMAFYYKTEAHRLEGDAHFYKQQAEKIKEDYQSRLRTFQKETELLRDSLRKLRAN